jgi:uncharacterized protein (TIGR02147 family)
MEMMNEPTLDYRSQLNSELRRRKIGNPSYSMRAFAKTLDLSAAFLSKVLKGQKDLSAVKALAIAEKLGYNPQETAQFCQLVQVSKVSNPKLKAALSYGLNPGDHAEPEFHPLGLEAFQVISDWYHYAILELAQCQGARSAEKFTPDYIAKRLGISAPEASAALSRLIRLGLLEKNRQRLTKTNRYLTAGTPRPSRAFRHFHLQMIEKAKQAVEGQPMDLRDISGSTIPISLDKLELAKKEIQLFRRKMAKLLDSAKPTEVYQLNIQFFALSQTGEKK